MGRIETAGEILLDIKEALELTGKSRSTFYRLVSRGLLVKVPVKSRKGFYITLESINRVKKRYKTKKRLRDSAVRRTVSISDVMKDEHANERREFLSSRIPEAFT